MVNTVHGRGKDEMVANVVDASERVAMASLSHSDGQVRCYADWYLEHSGKRRLRGLPVNRKAAAKNLRLLRRELKRVEGVAVYRVYSGQQLLNTFEDRADAIRFAEDRERETGFRVQGSYNRVRLERVRFDW